MADDADEVKVFRRHDEDETEAPSLADDKKDVDMEEEMESKHSTFIGGKGAFQPAIPSPSFPLLQCSPSFGTPYSFMPFVFNPAATVAAFNQLQRLSPAYPLMGMGMNAMTSPSFEMYHRLMGSFSPSFVPKMGNGMNGIPLPPSMRPSNALSQMNQMLGGSLAGHHMPSTASSHSTPKRKKEKEEHIKKPMNAFMWFMKENRPKLMEEFEFKEKQSAELNKELGKRWQDLDKDEQKKYYEMATKDKEDHQKKYPGWSARENYAINKKKKKKRDRTVVSENGEAKKCRARFGVNATDKWCAPCRRKKKCAYVGQGDDEERTSSHSAQRASDSESDLEDDTMLTGRDLDEMDDISMVVS